MTVPPRADAASRVRADRATWRALCDEVGRERMEQPGPMGEWTFKDGAGHLAGWRNRTIARLEEAAQGRPEPAAPWPAELDDDDFINAWIHRRDEGRTLDDVLDDYDTSFERLARAIEALPDELAMDPNAFAWAEGTPISEGRFGGHFHEEHEPSVRAWLATLS